MKGEEPLISVSMESWEGEVALEVAGESRSDSELPRTFIHSITVVPVAVLDPDRDLEDRGWEGISKSLKRSKQSRVSAFTCKDHSSIHQVARERRSLALFLLPCLVPESPGSEVHPCLCDPARALER